jgi:hypothetical protein
VGTLFVQLMGSGLRFDLLNAVDMADEAVIPQMRALNWVP